MSVVAVINSRVFLYSITSGGHTFKCLNRFQIACFESQYKKSDMSDFEDIVKLCRECNPKKLSSEIKDNN